MAREFLKKRGVKSESVSALQLGFAPPQWDRLFNHLRRQGLEPEHIAKAGLIVEKQSSAGYYDRFRDRMMFPIFSENGDVIAFGGRTLLKVDASAGVPKFVNSPETAIYTKGRELYGLNLTREHVRKAAEAVIVEGYMDFLVLFQEGIRTCVACLGTSLTRPQVKILNRHGARGVLNFDPDPAGRAAIIRSLEIFFEEDAGVRVLALPTGFDPDDFILKEGLKAYEELLANAPAGEIFALDTLFLSYTDHATDGRVADVTEYLRLIRHMSNAVRQDLALREASARFRIGIDQLRAELARLPDPQIAAVSSYVAPASAFRRAPGHAEKRLLLYSVANARQCSEVAAELASLKGLVCQPLFKKLAVLATRGENYDQKRVFQILDEEEAAGLSGVLMEAEEAGWPDSREITSCLQALRNDAGDMMQMQNEIEHAAADPELLDEALRRKQESARRLYEVDN